MKLKKIYRFDNKRQIWRIIPIDTGKLVIEEREPDKKQVFFHCLEIDSGKKIFKDFQLDDKFWLGIEAVQDDIIYFHKFAKPDMPKHKGIYAFDIKSKEIIWENAEIIFQFIHKDKLYGYRDKFEGRSYYSLNALKGETLEEIGNDYEMINQLRNKSIEEERETKGYLFPESVDEESNTDNRAKNFVSSLRNDFVISGKIEFIAKNDLLMMSFHEANSKGSLNNLFKAVDLSKGKYILEEVINKETSLFLTDSFFVKDEYLFLLFGKSRLQVYKIIE